MPLDLGDVLGNLKIDGKRPFKTIGDQLWSEIPFWIKTGAPSLDRAIAGNKPGIEGGIPHTRVIEIFGMESSGKSSLLESIIKNLQDYHKGYTLLCDAEHAHDDDRMIDQGIDKTLVSMIEKDKDDDTKTVNDITLEEFFSYSGAALKAIRAKDADTPILVGLDSLAMIDTDSQKIAQEEDRNLKMNENTDKAKIMSSRFGRFASSIVQSNATLIIVNQLREKPGVQFGDPRYTPGGSTLRFLASVRIGVAKKEFIYPKDDIYDYDHEDPVGIRIEFKIVKNKVSAPFRTGVFPLMFDSRGIWTDKCWIDTFFYNKIWERTKAWEKSGAWHSWRGTRMGQGEANVLRYLVDQPDTMEDIINVYLNGDSKEET